MSSQKLGLASQRPILALGFSLLMVTTALAVLGMHYRPQVHRWSEFKSSLPISDKIVVAQGETLILDIAAPPPLRQLNYQNQRKEKETP